MALGVRLRRDAEALDLESRRVGPTLLVHPRGELSRQALAFAKGLPADPEHQVVVLDLPSSTTDATWTVLARLLARGAPDGYRLVMGRLLPGGFVPVGQWLADRLDRAVVVPDGALVPAAGGVLYVPPDGGSGWVRLLPRRRPIPVSRRFPKPVWEFSVSDRAWRTSDHAVVDPLPSGVWLRGDGDEEALSPHRGLLVSRLAYRTDLLTVVLGCPGGDALSLDDVSRFWDSLLPSVRDLVRFVTFGPLAVPEGNVPGQALADRLGFPVTLDNGLPVGQAVGDTPEVHTLDTDGSLGWAAFARQLRYTPTGLTGGWPTEPMVVGHRSVLEDLPEIAPGRYRYDEAVLEVVPSGLWLRSSEEPAEAAVIRSAAPSARHINIVFGTVVHATSRMRELAERLLQRLDPALRALVRLVPAAQMVRHARARELTAAPAGEEHDGASEGETGEPAAPERAVAAAADPAATAAAAAAALVYEASGPLIRSATVAPAVHNAPAGQHRQTAAAEATATATATGVTAGAPIGATAGGSVGTTAGAGPVGVASHAGVTEPEPYIWAYEADGITAPPAPAVDERNAPAPDGSTGPASPLPLPRPDEAAVPEGTLGTTPGGEPAPTRTARQLPPGPPLPSVRLVSAPGAPAGAPAAAATGTTGGGPATGRPHQGDDARATAAPTNPASAPPSQGTGPAEGAPTARTARTNAPQRASEPASAARDGRPAPRATGARVQPVPSPAACAVPPRKGIAREREWLRNAFRQQYNDGSGTVARLLSESPGLRGTIQTATEDVLTDLVAARLYLRGDGPLFDRQVREAVVGPHVPLARCVTAGLRRLPSYRGATALRAALGDAEWDWYRRQLLVTEWAFCSALTAAAPALPGDVDFLIWSMTARRTALLAPDLPARVMFVPGTNFKVLAVRDDGRRTVLLRELSASEVSADGRVDTERNVLDDIALSGLDLADRTWRDTEPEEALALPPEQAAWFAAPPGLILAPGPGTPDTPAAQAPPGKRTTP